MRDSIFRTLLAALLATATGVAGQEAPADTAALFKALQQSAAELERAETSAYNATPPAVADAQRAWAAGELPVGEPPPTIQRSAEVWVPFGLEHPVVRCTQARACAVQLEAGEIVHHIQLGDDTHWVSEQGLVGEPDNPAPMVYFSPRIADIGTNAFISTTRRLYSIGLISPPIRELEAVKEGQAHYTRVLRFYYGDGQQEATHRELAEIREILQARELRQRRELAPPDAAPEPVEPVAKPQPVRSQAYAWKPKPKSIGWNPSEVWDDGERTYIKLPAGYRSPALPAVTVTVDRQESVPNHHYDPDTKTFVVHQLFDRADLVLKWGPKKREYSKVKIERKGAR